MRVANTPEAIIHVLRCPVEQIKIDNRTLRGVERYQPGPREGSSMSVILLKIKNQTGEAIFPAMLRGEIHPVTALRVVQAHSRVLDIKFL
jgi:hypothetical protein